MAASRLTFNFKETDKLPTSKVPPWYNIAYNDRSYVSPITQVDQDAWENFCSKVGTGKTKGTPIGEVIIWASLDIPDGYIVCDGREFNVNDPNYKDLYDVISPYRKSI